ncbi:MAG TPA: hypothetical protein VFE23_01290 [Usitatibacter sp.]|jgi:hypothetical protein|nr:hypothetical protein [Usitatibacter sp.]
MAFAVGAVSEAHEFDGWLPVRVFWHGGAARVDWCWFGDRPLAEPFFRDSANLAMRHPFNQAFRRETPIDALSRLREERPGMAPTAFLHHASRCGSTLVSQMLAATGEHVVVSEPHTLDAILRARYMGPGVAAGSEVEWARGLLSALAQSRRGERAFVVKLDAWSIFELHTLREAFPATPWVYLYRDPLEIAVSQVRERGAYMVPGMLGPALELLGAVEVARMPHEEFIARVLGRMLEAAGEGCAREGGVLLHYEELPEALWTWAAPLFGVRDDPAIRAALGHAARWNAKNPQLEFESDSGRKQREASPALREAIERWAHPAYHRLETARLAARAARGPRAMESAR